VLVAPWALTVWVAAAAGVVAAPVDAEALGEAEELAEDDGVADFEDEADGDGVLLGLCDAFEVVEPEEADEPSPR
jgi:hypothetical protein